MQIGYVVFDEVAMKTRKPRGHPVLILGGGRGGSALLEMFLDDPLVEVIGIADPSPDAPGIRLALAHAIPTHTDALAAMRACKDYQDCIIYNLTHDEAIPAQAVEVFGDKHVTSGPEAKLFWQMVTHLKQVKTELEKSQNQLQAIIRNVMDGIVTVDASGEIQGFNPAAEKIFGYTQREVLGQNITMFIPPGDRTTFEATIQHYLDSEADNTAEVRSREIVAVRKNGELFPVELSASAMMLGGLRYFVGIVRDITERKLAEQKITHLAHYDPLTDLPNRALFLDRLATSVALAKRERHKIATIFLDLDGFKQVNDTHGHDVGDMLLRGVSTRLTKTIRSSDTVARIGGDEFTFILNNIGAEENALAVADKIIAALAPPFDFGGRICKVGGSIGIAIFPDDADSVETLVKQADEAMYLSKQSGKNTRRLYRDVLALANAKS
ncbi:MAG: diguanylate cyclase [Gallionella sp.]|jgi:diguanylate cyclase (GGDEF)-like protein/PAS domain S-box-containing protein|nr:diguanylate cyclase [Gallionella sp.]